MHQTTTFASQPTEIYGVSQQNHSLPSQPIKKNINNHFEMDDYLCNAAD